MYTEKSWEVIFDEKFPQCKHQILKDRVCQNCNRLVGIFGDEDEHPIKDFIRNVADQAYKQGKQDEKKDWIESVVPGQVLISIRSRSEDGKDIDGLKQYIPIKGIVDWGRSFLMKHLEEITLKIITAPVLKKAIVESAHTQQK